MLPALPGTGRQVATSTKYGRFSVPRTALGKVLEVAPRAM